MIYDLKKILDIGEENGFAVPAFNVYNLETVMGVMQAAEETGAPVIFQMYSRLFDSQIAQYVAPIIREAMNNMKTPVAFHLDHGAGIPEVLRAFRYGATGVMIDASTLDFNGNAALTRRVVETAAYSGVYVEGELGHVGSVNDDAMDEFTEPEQAARFVRETGVAALAVLVGSAHGKYKKPPKLDIQRTADIAAATGIPLVLHGGSGIPDDQIRAAVKAGICKVNYATDLCYAFMDTLAAQIDTRPALDLFMKKPIEAVQAFAENRIELVGAAGKA